VNSKLAVNVVLKVSRNQRRVPLAENAGNQLNWLVDENISASIAVPIL
jgi:hypothetical protein